MKLLLINRQQGIIFILILTLTTLLTACSGGEATTKIPADSSSAGEDSVAAEDSTEQEATTEAEDSASTEDTASTEPTAAGGVANAPGADTEAGQLFIERCAKCHGLEGLGNGPSVGSLSTQSGLNLKAEELQAKSDEEILVTISQGKESEMPPWGLILTLEERESLVQHIRLLGNQ